MSHAGSYVRLGGSYSLAFQRVMKLVLDPQGTSVGRAHLTSPFYRLGDTDPAIRGEIHGAADFNFEGGGGSPLNARGVSSVYSPISGTLVSRSSGLDAVVPGGVGGGDGGVFIKDSAGVVHGLLHLDSLSDKLKNAAIGTQVTAGDALGYMGGRLGNSPNALLPHVHYAMYLNFDSATAEGNKIDPVVYWTPGLNPNAPLDGSGQPSGTGLVVTVAPISDLNDNGAGAGAAEYLNGSVIRESQSSFLKVGVNTPHTQPITLRLRFSDFPSNVMVLGVGSVTVSWNPLQGSAFITLPATDSQSQPNTSGYIEIFALEESDTFLGDNALSEKLTYTIEAGYRDSSNTFTPYSSSLFAPVRSGVIFFLDNDQIPVVSGATVFGTPGHDVTGFYDPDNNGINDADPATGDLVAHAGTAAIYGLAGDDVLDGNGIQGIRLFGDSGDGSTLGNDIVHADNDGVNRYYGGQMGEAEQAEKFGGNGATLFGGGGNDILFGGLRNDVIDGDSGNDFAEGRVGADRIAGGSGADWLDGQEGGDVIQGDDGSDFLFGGAGADLLQGGDDDDTLYGDADSGPVFLDRRSGHVMVLASDDSSLAGTFGIVRDVALSDAGSDVLEGGAGKDMLYAGDGKDVLDGGENDDVLQGEGGDDFLFGGSGDDILWGDSNPKDIATDENIVVTAGFYRYYTRLRITGNDGNDTLDGGTGNDSLYGGMGNDTYLFGLGSGQDSIGGILNSPFVYGGPAEGGGTDVIRLGDFILPGDVRLILDNGNLLVSLLHRDGTATGDVLTVRDWFSDANQRVEFIQFADGTVWDEAVVRRLAGARVPIDSPTVQTNPEDTSFRLAFSPSSISESFYRIEDLGGSDTLTIDRVAYANNPVTGLPIYATPVLRDVTKDGGDLLLSVRIDDGFANTEDREATVRIANFAGNGRIENIVIGEQSYEFVDPDNVTPAAIGSETPAIYAKLPNSGPYYLPYPSSYNGPAASFLLVGSDGGADFVSAPLEHLDFRPVELRGLAGSDDLAGTAFGDLLIGGRGDDFLSGGGGPDTYLFNRGDGKDTIYEFETPSTDSYYTPGPDTLQFGSDIAPADVALSTDGASLLLRVNGIEDQVTLSGWLLNAGTAYYVERVAFSDGTIWDEGYIRSHITVPTGGIDVIGTENDDFTGGGNGNDHVEGRGGGDRLSGGPGNDFIEGGEGSDSIFGNQGNDVLDSGSGNDLLDGGSGDDTYLFYRGIGIDTLRADESGNDTIRLAPDILPTGVSFVPAQFGIALRINGTSDSLILEQWYDNPGYIETITFADGTVWNQADIVAHLAVPAGTGSDDLIYGSPGADVIDGGAGNDSLRGLLGDDTIDGGEGSDLIEGGRGNDRLLGSAGDDHLTGNEGSDTLIGGDGDDFLDGEVTVSSLTPPGNNVFDGGAGFDFMRGGGGNDTYLVYRGSGFDSIRDAALIGSKADVVIFGAGITPESIRVEVGVSKFDSELVDLLWVDIGNNEGFVIRDETYSKNFGIDQFRFADGRALTLPQLLALDTDPTAGIGFQDGTSGDDVLPGNDFQNQLDGDAGNDLLVGHQRMDTLVGGSGDDILVGGRGVDELSGGSGSDTYLFNPGDASSVVDEMFQAQFNERIRESSGEPSDVDTISFGGGIRPEDIEAALQVDEFNGVAYFGVLYLRLRTTGERIDLSWLGSASGNPVGQRIERVQFLGNGAGSLFDLAALVQAREVELRAAYDANFAQPEFVALFRPDDLSTFALTRTFPFAGGEHALQYASQGTVPLTPVRSATIGTGSADSLIGTAADDEVFGFAGDDFLDAGTGNDFVDGGGGADTMFGGPGDDTYVVENVADVVREAGDAGTDTVQSSVTYMLPDNVERLVLNGTKSINATGNVLDNILSGNAADNVLNGNGGSDTMIGGQGDDVYVVDNSGDATIENTEEGLDRVDSSITQILAENIEILFLTGSTGINGSGNTLDNLLRGNSAKNFIEGGGGIDILEGGSGNDTLSNTSGNSLLDGGVGADTLLGTNDNDILIGGVAKDIVNTGAGADVIAFNLGDGRDTVAASHGLDNTLTIGGGVGYADIVFRKDQNDLILRLNASDQITLLDYYASPNNRSVKTLQVILDGSRDYNASSSDFMYSKKVQAFDFSELVAAFDDARSANPSLTSWALSGGLADAFLGGSDTAAIGGDLAYRYGRYGSLSDVSFSSAIDILAGDNFGASTQQLQSLPSLQNSSPRLS